MKIIEHEKSPKLEAMTLTTNPMSVFVTKTVEVKIERGDLLRDVAKTIRKYMPSVSQIDSYHLGALWFAMGERLKKKLPDENWTKSELNPKPGRKYNG